MNPDYEKFFPFPKIRDEQRASIEFALKAYASGKRFVLLELGTGTGKSAIGITVAQCMTLEKKDKEKGSTGSYVLTTQKILQDQYADDFGPGTQFEKLRSLKASGNYKCTHWPGRTCAESKRVLNVTGERAKGTAFHEHCSGHKCPYTSAKIQFASSRLSVTNFSFFLASAMYTDFLKKRDILVIDECHNINDELRKFIQTAFSEAYCTKLGVPFLVTENDAKAFTWVKEKFYPAMVSRKKALEKKIEDELDKTGAVSDPVSKEFEAIDKHLCKLNRFLAEYSDSNWVLTFVDNRGKRSLEFRPIDVTQDCHEMLYEYADYVLMMSATVIDVDIFCKNNGLKRDEVAYLSIQSPFKTKNRQVYYTPVGSMSKDYIETTLPRVAEAVKCILENHKKDKGIIHAVNYKIAQYIKNNVKDSRLLIHNSENREEVLEKHILSKKPTVLISPSMSEGVDLSDDLSRFQILCKIPYPFLGDKLVVKRMKNDERWYSFETVKTIVQSLGRSVRNENDHAVSYVLDAGFKRFYGQYHDMFPPEFEQMLVME